MAYELPQDWRNRPVAIIGAGTLGRRIATVFASGGALVHIIDTNSEALQAAADYVTDTAGDLTARLENAETIARRDPQTFSDAGQGVPGAWLVIEAVPEKLEIKRPLFGQLDAMADADALLATNSSSYASAMMIGEVKHPERVFNMHFAMPPQSLAVELMSDRETTEGLLEELAEILPVFGIVPFIAHAQSTGFIFNRIWAAIKREALAVVSEGVSTPEDVDELMRINTGMPHGPFAMMDQVGLDVVLDIEEHYAAENPHLPTGPRELLHSYVDAGKLGRKNGEGFYTY